MKKKWFSKNLQAMFSKGRYFAKNPQHQKLNYFEKSNHQKKDIAEKLREIRGFNKL